MTRLIYLVGKLYNIERKRVSNLNVIQNITIGKYNPIEYANSNSIIERNRVKIVIFVVHTEGAGSPPWHLRLLN